MGQTSRRALLAGALALGLAGCSRDQPATTAPATTTTTRTPSATPTPTPTPERLSGLSVSPTPLEDHQPRWPLTGRPLSSKQQAHHAAVAVKVPDNKVEHPQVGLDAADIVFVELEGYRDSAGYSATRLMPVFHSRMPDDVAPVRSVRPVDVPLLSPLNALVGNTGSSPWVTRYVHHYRAHLDAALTYLATRGTGAYSIDGSRVYTYNGQTYYDRAVVCHPKVLAKQTKRFRSGPPRAYFPWATGTDEVSTAHGKQGRSLRIPYKGDSYFMGYHYDAKSKRYLRSMPWGPHVLANGKRVSTDNVLVIKAKQRYGKIYRGRGGAEPLQDIIKASGRFWYFHRGRYVTGTWHKGKRDAPFTFSLPGGTPFRMAPGQTYVELPDTHAKLRIGS